MQRFEYMDLASHSRDEQAGRQTEQHTGCQQTECQETQHQQASNQEEQPSMMQMLQLMMDQNRQREEMMATIMQTVTANASHHNESSFRIMPDLAQNVPTFDGEGGSLKAKEWLNSIETTSNLHRWPEPLKLEAARAHLKAAANHWFVARIRSISTWEDFRAQFSKTFIGGISLPEKWKKIENRVQLRAESTHKYFHEKVLLCEDLGLDFPDLKKRLVIGLYSKSLCENLMARSHHNADELLDDIRDFEEVTTERLERIALSKKDYPLDQRRSTLSVFKKPEDKGAEPSGQYFKPKGSSNAPIPVNRQETSGDKRQPIRCFNCNKSGHIAFDCPEPRKPRFCRLCKQEGHVSQNCPTSGKNGMLVVTRTNDRDSSPLKYFKTAVLNGTTLQAMIDNGSSSCTLQASAAIKCNLQVQKTNDKLYGFGDTEKIATQVLGKSVADIEIDGVIGNQVAILVVPDKAQPVEILIGRTWTELPSIAFAKVGDQFKIGYRNDYPFTNIEVPKSVDRVRLTLANNVELQRNTMQWITVGNNSMQDELVAVYTEGNLGKLVQLENGTSKVPIINNTVNTISLKKGHCVGRAEVVSIVSDKQETAKCDEYTRKLEEPRPILLQEIKIDDDATNVEKQQLLSLVNEYRDCFAMSMSELGCTNLTEMNIVEREGSKPVASRPYKTSAEEREEIGRIVKEWKEHGIVTETRSPYASPVLLVKKKTGEKRLVVDYRRLNQQTIQDKYPLPKIDDQLERIAEGKLFTVLDLAHGYLQVPLAEEAKQKTAFITSDESGQFERMVFGLTNAPAEFQRLMNQALGTLRNTVVRCFLDDLLIPAKDWPEMLESLRSVLQALREANLTCKLSKCEFGKRTIEYLGFVVSEGTLQPGPRKVQAIADFPRPQSVHDVRRWLGLTGFFRRFIIKYASRAEPLTRLMKKDVDFKWGVEQESAFQDLKLQLISEPVLQLYNPAAKTELHTDASAMGVGAMLLQEGNDGKMHLVYCISKKTTDAEKNYHSSKLELMAVVWGIDRLRQFLIGIPFSVVTDCQALVYLNAQRTLNPQIARWYNLLQEYDITEIRHRPGDKMLHVDALSRAPVEDSDSGTIDEIVENRCDVFMTLSQEDQVLMMQQGDDDLRQIISIMKKSTKDKTAEERGRTSTFELKNGRLFKIDVRHGDRKLLYVIPKSMRKSMVVRFHDCMGHFGVDRVVAKICEHYWFAGIRRYVKQHIRMCFECLLHKTAGGKKPGLLHPIPPGLRPFDVIHIDHLGPFVRSSHGNQELLVVIDNLTKFVKLYPSRTTSTKSVIKALEEFILERGLPGRIISDRGSCFTSKEFEEFCETNGIKHTLNSARHPEGNGQVERVNRTIIPMIAIAIKNPTHRDWDTNIKEVERNVNNAVNKTTSKTPFELLHGYIPRFHDGALRELTDESENIQWKQPEDLQREAREKIVAQQEVMKSAYDKKHHGGVKFSVGEIVVMKRAPVYTGQPTKTQPRFRGPLVVTKVLPGDTYRVTQLEADSKRFYATTAHTNQLKSWSCVADEEEHANSDPGSDDDETELIPDQARLDEVDLAENTPNAEIEVRVPRQRRRPAYLNAYV